MTGGTVITVLTVAMLLGALDQTVVATALPSAALGGPAPSSGDVPQAEADALRVETFPDPDDPELFPRLDDAAQVIARAGDRHAGRAS